MSPCALLGIGALGGVLVALAWVWLPAEGLVAVGLLVLALLLWLAGELELNVGWFE